MVIASRYRTRRWAAMLLLAIVNAIALAFLAGGSGKPVVAAALQLRFVNQPTTTQTGSVITDGFGSSGTGIQVEFVDSSTGLRATNATGRVTISLGSNPAGGTLTGGGALKAVSGVATFSNLKINADGVYRLRASSQTASNQPLSNHFTVADQVTTCSSGSCAFSLSQGQNSYTVDPTLGTEGANYASSLNFGGLTVSCDFAPYNYPDIRQPNTVFFDYQGSGTKVVTIVIDKKIVQETAENGASKYRVCFSSPDPFRDIFGEWAPIDTSTNGPSSYFGGTWYIGLLPDCKNPGPVAPCVLSWSASNGDRIGKFLAPAGDPTYR
jgi:hypothetical protein